MQIFVTSRLEETKCGNANFGPRAPTKGPCNGHFLAAKRHPHAFQADLKPGFPLSCAAKKTILDLLWNGKNMLAIEDTHGTGINKQKTTLKRRCVVGFLDASLLEYCNCDNKQWELEMKKDAISLNLLAFIF